MNNIQPPPQDPWLTSDSITTDSTFNPWSEKADLFAAFTQNGINSLNNNGSMGNDLTSIFNSVTNLDSFFSQPAPKSIVTTSPTTGSLSLSPDIGSLFRSFRDQNSDLILNPSSFINNNNSTSQPNFQLPIGTSLKTTSSLQAKADVYNSKKTVERTSKATGLNPKANAYPQYTELVQVRSSAHVSYIVGKQGTKIRQIRTETETHIKTPVNGEDPVFELTGRKENVEMAKELILKEEVAFSKSLYNRACNYKEGDRRMLNLYLPSRYIGLVVGKKGSSIKRIMEMSSTTIVTPKVNTINIFEVFGTHSQIQKAVELIKMHITCNNDVNIIEEANSYEVTLKITPK